MSTPKPRFTALRRIVTAVAVVLMIPTTGLSHHQPGQPPHSNWDGLAATGTFSPVFEAVSHPLAGQQSDLTIRFQQNPDEDAVGNYRAMIPGGYRFAIGSLDFDPSQTSCADFLRGLNRPLSDSTTINRRAEAIGVAKLAVSTTSTNFAPAFMLGQSYFLGYSETTKTALFCALVGMNATTAIPSPNNQVVFDWTMTLNADQSWTVNFDLKSVFPDSPPLSVIDNSFYQNQDVTVRDVSLELRGLTYGNYNVDEGPSSSVVQRLKNLTTPDLVFRTSTPAGIGDTLQYEIAFENAGSAVAHAATVSEPLPAHVTYEAGSCSGAASCQLSADGTKVEWTLGDVPAHTVQTLSFRGTVANTFGAAASTKSRATGSSDEEDSFRSNETIIGNEGNAAGPLSSIITGVHIADLDPEGYYPGSNTTDPLGRDDALEYRTTYTNNGTGPATHVVVGHPLPVHTKYQVGTCQPAASTIPNGMSCGISADSKRMEWRLDQVPAGQTRQLTFRVLVDNGFDDNAGIRTMAFGTTDQETTAFQANDVNVAVLAHRKVAFAYTPQLPGQYTFRGVATPCGFDPAAADPVLCVSGASPAQLEDIVGISNALTGYHPLPEIQTPAQMVAAKGVSFARPILGRTSVDFSWTPPNSGPVESRIKGYVVTTGVPYQSQLIHFDYLISNPNAPGYDPARDPCAPDGTAPECTFAVQFPLTTTNGGTLGPNGLYSTSVVAVYMDGHRSDGRCDNGTGPGAQPPCADGSTPTFIFPGFTARQYVIRSRAWPLVYAAFPTGHLYVVLVDLDNHEAEFIEWIPYGVGYPMVAATILGSNAAATGLVSFIDNSNQQGKKIGFEALVTPVRLQGYFIKFTGPSGLPDPGNPPIEIAANRM